MPLLGLGTYKLENNETTSDLIVKALDVGYRHIDTASAYGNEEAIGEGIKKSPVSRKNIFLVSKVANSDQGYDNTIKSFNESLKRLQTDYLDLYLIHWPKDLSNETWKAFEDLYKENKIRTIGVSNFLINHLEDLLLNAKITPMVNQVEFHPYLVQPELLDYCSKKNIKVEAWSPLMRGEILNIDLIDKLAKKYNKTHAQIVLRWNIQMGVITIPKSANIDRIKSNFQIFDFELSKEDMLSINQLDKGHRTGPDPNNFDF
ncbi:aldo/keto reductase [Herbivorax sp. ANBcel31]|uniref:aldo/keto reductase n=1 Tax=Herbivorax sp. ANBcel31 TaxID=3069754 RepID=UPI0027B70483|nr:aldo/keto reductase [Herbivorax sp. ANBcel31]MDQ2085052.1 aldo/keto reductase [Herbivorax sp. ANBcel31]